MSSAIEQLAALAGTYRHSDGCTRRVFTHKGKLYQARTRPGRAEEPYYEVAPAAVQRLIDYRLFHRTTL